MSANVRCAGGGQWREGYEDAELGHIRSFPCGWTGERSGRPTKIHGEIHWNIHTIPDDPCPECGGRVELIPKT